MIEQVRYLFARTANVTTPVAILAILILVWSDVLATAWTNLGWAELASALNDATERQSLDIDGTIDRSFRKAIQLDSSQTSAWRALAFTLILSDRMDEAKKAATVYPYPFASTFALWGNQATYYNRNDLAEQFYRTSLDIDTAQADVWDRLGVIHRRKEARDEALNAFSQAVTLGNADSILPLAWMLHQRSEYDASIKIWRQGLDDFPTHVQRIDWWNGLANSLRSQEEWQEIIKVTSQALQEFPDDPRLYVARGRAIYSSTGDTKQASDMLQNAIALEPDLTEAYIALGQIMVQEEQRSAAIDWYAEAVKLEPERTEWRMLQANTARDAGDNLLARELYERIIALSPDYAPAHYQLALIHWRQGNDDRALRSIETAIELAQSTPTSYLLRSALIHEHVGNHAHAIAVYRRVLVQDSDNQAALEGMTRLNEIKSDE